MLLYIYLYKLTERRKSGSDVKGFGDVRCNKNVVLIVEQGSDKKKRK
jgi:hypothetical protein